MSAEGAIGLAYGKHTDKDFYATFVYRTQAGRFLCCKTLLRTNPLTAV